MALQLETLHGPPELGGTTLPYATFETPVSGELDWSESVTKTLADGTVKLIQDRRRRRWRLGWKDLTEAEYQTIIDLLDSRTGLTWVPRTINTARGDSALATEPSYTVRVASDSHPVTRRLNLDRFDVNIELEEVTWHS